MTFYRNVGLIEAYLVWKSGAIAPYYFEGSSDSTATKGDYLSFWFDRPYQIQRDREFLIETDVIPTSQGTMKYYFRNFDGFLVSKTISEFYHSQKVSAHVTLLNDKDMEILRDELKEADVWFDSRYVRLPECLATIFSATKLEEGNENQVFVSSWGDEMIDGYFNKEDIIKFLGDIKSFIEFLESSEKSDYESLPR